MTRGVAIAIAIAESDPHEPALNALRHSLAGFDARQVIVFSDRPQACTGGTCQ